MGFKKGTSGNVNGKPRGASNHTTKQTKEVISNLLEKEFSSIEEYKTKVTPNEWLNVLIKLIPYVLPKQTHVETSVTEQAPIDWERLFKPEK